MGTVYKAEQRTPIKRIVALKVIKAGLGTREVLARFESERQALARMDHPNVARVLDAGSDERGRPYFAMEYVPGVPLTEFADSKKLPLRDRLELFVQVCSAITHAHTKALIHRDIKASNVLACLDDGKPIVKVIDFGIAKALTGDKLTDRTFNTESGNVIGTYDSMSPEQAEGSPDIDTRTDVYSLGVLLYELLAGAKPFEQKSLANAGDQEIRRMIREVDPPRPSQRLSSLNDRGSGVAAVRRTRPESLVRELRTELEWIPLKAMRKERDRRYGSPEELASDIKNYLSGRPLKAGPESLIYRFRKTLSRHRGTSFIAVALITLLATGSALYVHGIRAEQHRTFQALLDVKDEQRKTKSALDDAEAQRKKAVENSELAARRFDEKRAALDQMLQTFSDNRLKGQPGSQPVRKLFLERGLEQYQAMLEDRADDPSVVLRTGEAFRELGLVSKELGDSKESLNQLRKAAEVCRAATIEHPDSVPLRAALGDAAFELAQALFEQQQNPDAKPFADESATVFASLSEASPQNVEYKAKWGRALVRRASLREQGELQKADLDLALKLLREAHAAAPDNPLCLQSLARAVNNDASDRSRSTQEALAGYREAHALISRALEVEPALPLGNSLRNILASNVVRTLRNLGQPQDALEFLDSVLAASRRHIAENPAVVDGPVFLVQLLNERAILLQAVHRAEEAIRDYEEIIATSDGLAKSFPAVARHDIASLKASYQIAHVLQSQKRDADAIAHLKPTAERSKAKMELHSTSGGLLSQVLSIHEKLGGMLSESHKTEECQKTYEAGVSLYQQYRRTAVDDSEESLRLYLVCCQGLLGLARKQNDGPRAIELLEKRVASIPLDQVLTADTRGSLLLLLANLSSLYADAGRLEEAINLRVQVVEQARNILAGDRTSDWYAYQLVFGAHHHLAVLYRKAGNDRLAFESLRNHLGETESYMFERDHAAVLAETVEFTPENLKRLWDLHDKHWVEHGGQIRFTIPVDLNGISYTSHVYVAESWSHLNDQFTWVEKVRGGKVSKELRSTFRMLYERARQGKVSYKDLCVWALTNNPKPAELSTRRHEETPVLGHRKIRSKAFDQVTRELAALRREVAEAEEKDPPRRALTFRLATLAEEDVAQSNLSRAALLLDDARGLLELDALGRLRNPKDADLYAYVQYVSSALLASRGKHEDAHSLALECLKSRPADAGDFAVPKGALEHTLGWTSTKLGRPIEAAAWYRRAADIGHSSATQNLCLLVLREPALALTMDDASLARTQQMLDGFRGELSATGKKLSGFRNPERRYGAARAYALGAATMAFGRSELTEEQRNETEKLHMLCLECLNAAIASGIQNGVDIRTQADFKALRDSPKFAQLLDGKTWEVTLPTSLMDWGVGPESQSLVDLPFPDELLDERVVIAMAGQDASGEPVFAFVEITVRKMKEMREKQRNEESFDPSDFGKVVASGKGEPSDEVKAKLAAEYKLLSSSPDKAAKPANSPEVKPEGKSQ